MADGMYIGMAGAAARAEQLDSVADNLANVQTPGFKAARPAFEAFLAPGATEGADKVSTAAVATGIDLRPGALVPTGDDLDVLPEEGDFLAVRAQDGGRAYTRAGSLSVDGDGRLLAAGRPVLDRNTNEPLQLPPGSLRPEVDAEGRVRVAGEEVGQLAVAHLEGPMERRGPALLAPVGAGTATPSDVKLQRGVRELGNANAMEATVQMIAAQRNYDTSMQALQTYKRLDDRANEVGKTR